MVKVLSSALDPQGANVFSKKFGLAFCFDGGGSALAGTEQVDLPAIPFGCMVTGWTLVSDAPTGSVVVNVLRSTYANFPTMSSIAGSEKPTLNSEQKAQDLALTTWTTALLAGDVLRASLESAVTIKRLALTLWITRTE